MSQISYATKQVGSEFSHNDANEIKTVVNQNDQQSRDRDADLQNQITAVSNPLPSQTGQSGKFLTTNGTAASWGTPTGGTTLPSQTGQAGKVLGTNGTTTSWVPQTGGGTGITEQTLVAGPAVQWDLTLGKSAKLALTQNGVLTVSGAQNGDAGILVVTQDATGGRTLGIDGLFENGDTLATGANNVTMVSFFRQSDVSYFSLKKYAAAAAPTGSVVTWAYKDNLIEANNGLQVVEQDIYSGYARTTETFTLGNSFTADLGGLTLQQGDLMFGLTTDATINAPADLVVGLYFASDGVYHAQGGTYANISSFATTDLFRVAVSNSGQVKYQKSSDGGLNYSDIETSSVTLSGSTTYYGGAYIQGMNKLKNMTKI